MPKCEIFDRLDSRGFYIVKPPCVDDFGTVIKNSIWWGVGGRELAAIRKKGSECISIR
jgi:hypothetical protein